MGEEGDRLMLACDGLTEQMSNEQIIEHLGDELERAAEGDPSYALGELFEKCILSGSQDNMSAVLVELMDGGTYGASKSMTFSPGPLFQSRFDRPFVKAYMKNARDFGLKDGPRLRKAAYRSDLTELRKQAEVDETLI